MVATVIVRAAIRALLAGVLLGAGRIAGETAPLLFASFSNRYWSTKWDQPAASLPVMIFTYAISPYEDWHRQAWAIVQPLNLTVIETQMRNPNLRRKLGRHGRGREVRWSLITGGASSIRGTSSKQPARCHTNRQHQYYQQPVPQIDV
jgi:hypothetical protein